jgi:hypothetical protein
MEAIIAVIIAVSCLGAYVQACRYFKAPFFIFLSTAIFLLSCGAITSCFNTPAYLDAATDSCLVLAGALMAIAAWQLEYAFKLAGGGT